MIKIIIAVLAAATLYIAINPAHAATDRLAVAERCAKFHGQPAHEKETLSARYKKMTEKQFADTMRDCIEPNWQQRAYFRKQVGLPVVKVASAVIYGPPQRLSPGEDQQLEGLLARKAVELLGPPPAGYDGYRNAAHHMPVPRGCTEYRVHDEHLRRTFVRLTCR